MTALAIPTITAAELAEGLCSRLMCPGCSWDCESIVPPDHCPKCGALRMERIEIQPIPANKQPSDFQACIHVEKVGRTAQPHRVSSGRKKSAA
jgi:Zn-finger nucleic acid-binding protein